MTGIAGHIGHPDSDLLLRMMQRLAHRGGGEPGYYIGGIAALAARQHAPPTGETSVIVEENGAKTSARSKKKTAERAPITGRVVDGQPFTDGPKTIRVVFDGELTNARELRADLIAAGAKFESEGDPEVVLEAYRRFNTGAFARLQGAFALAIWDQRIHTCFLARDAFGTRPLFVQRVGERLRFASEIKALTAAPNFPRELDPFAIHDYFTWGYIPAPRTIWRAVRALPAGHYAVFREGQLTTHRYFTLAWPLETEMRSREDWLLDLFAQLERALGRALMIDRGPGKKRPHLAIERGEESALLGVLAGRLSPTGNAVAHSVFFDLEPHPHDVSPHCAADLARRVGLPFQAVSVPMVVPQERFGAVDVLRQTLKDLAANLDQPIADPLLVFRLMNWRQLRANGGRVLIDSIGADEIFAGHRRIMALMRSERFGFAPPIVRDLAASLAEWVPEFEKTRLGRRLLFGPNAPRGGMTRRLERQFDQQMAMRDAFTPMMSAWREFRRFLFGFVHPTRERYLHWLRSFSSPAARQLFSPGFADICRSHDPFREFRIAFDRLKPGQPTRTWPGANGATEASGSWAEVAGARRDWPSDWDLPGAISGAIMGLSDDGAGREGRPLADRAMALDMAAWLPGFVVPGAEAVAAMAGITLRLPYLDQQLAEWATHLPASMKIGAQGGKRILQFALRETETEFCEAPDTQGMRREWADWLLAPGRLHGWMTDTLTSRMIETRGILNPKTVARILRTHETGGENLALDIFSIFMFELWCENH